jgi:hypothetical protein
VSYVVNSDSSRPATRRARSGNVQAARPLGKPRIGACDDGLERKPFISLLNEAINGVRRLLSWVFSAPDPAVPRGG